MKFYVYLWLRYNGTPYYVGKGCSDRAWVDGSRPVARPKEEDRIIVQQYDSEPDAYNAETFFIDFYGRKCEEGGVLHNRRRGGGKISQSDRCRIPDERSTPAALSFKCSSLMADKLHRLAKKEMRKTGSMIRILLEQQLATIDKEQDGKV